MLMSTKRQKRNYFRSYDGVSTNSYRMFLVRYLNGGELPEFDGPYGTMDEALDKVSEYLKNGTCAWAIGYNE
mgnify:CR=1 FL=1